MAFCWTRRLRYREGLQIENLRYSRVQLCTTSYTRKYPVNRPVLKSLKPVKLNIAGS